jgi:hypothetical protein
MRPSSMRPTCRNKSIAILELLAVVVVTAVSIVRQRKWGCIINLSSVAAQLGGCQHPVRSKKLESVDLQRFGGHLFLNANLSAGSL